MGAERHNIDMISEKLIGQEVMNTNTKSRGVILSVESGKIRISFHREIGVFDYPSIFANALVLKDQELQREISEVSADARFEEFKGKYINSIHNEITYLRMTGGKKYRIIDGERLITQDEAYVYTQALLEKQKRLDSGMDGAQRA